MPIAGSTPRAVRDEARDMVDAQRRALLKAAPLCLLAACARVPTPPTSFTARFDVAGAGTIALDYLDARNFAFEPDIGWGSTRVVDGRIHLVMLPSLATAGAERVILAGRLALPTKAGERGPPRLRADRNANPRAWGLDGNVHHVQVSSAEGEASPLNLVVGTLAPLARAQYVVDTRMRPGMDMGLCGDAVGRLVASWPSQVTGHGLAVLASTPGVRMVGPLRPLRQRPTLPAGVPVEDLLGARV